MLILRFSLLAIFALLFVLVATDMVHSTDPYQSNLSALVLFAIIFAVLGPMWPSKEKLEKLKLNLTTDNPRLAYPLLMAALSLGFFIFAADAWVAPSQSYTRLVAVAYSMFGNNGVVGFWVILGLLCLVGVYHGYTKYKSA